MSEPWWQEHGLDKQSRQGARHPQSAMEQGANLGASNVNHSNSDIRADQGHGEIGAKTEASSDVASLRVLINLSLQIGYVNRTRLQNGT